MSVEISHDYADGSISVEHFYGGIVTNIEFHESEEAYVEELISRTRAENDMTEQGSEL